MSIWLWVLLALSMAATVVVVAAVMSGRRPTPRQ